MGEPVGLPLGKGGLLRTDLLLSTSPLLCILYAHPDFPKS